MADQQSVARIVTAVSSVVVAVCAVVVTAKVVGADLDPAEPRVLDQAVLEQQVANRLQGVGDEPVGRVTCPGSVQVVVGSQFDCDIWDYLRAGKAHVEIVSDQGEIEVTRS